MFSFNVREQYHSNFAELWKKYGYAVVQDYAIKMSLEIADKETPVFTNSYINNAFEKIPNLYVTTPLDNGARISQIGMVYILAYILGMLARYFPTHWIALGRSEKGDALWPSINAAIHYIEKVYPQLVWEFILDRRNHT